MRPLRLEVEGFTAFRQRTSIDFSELDLFAITGPTGAGKSSLIDAVAYALYGRVPRVSNEIGACISQGLDRMWVQLEFEAGRGTYRVFREARRRKTNSKALGQGNVRLEQCRGGEWEPLEDRSEGVNRQVQAAIGLDFDGFTRSVVLPQGQFQEFLAGSPDKRREVLRGLLRLDIYDGLAGRARTLAAQLSQRRDDAQRRLDEDFADATRETLERVRAQNEQTTHEIASLTRQGEALARGVRFAEEAAAAARRLDDALADRKSAEQELATTQRLVGDAARVIDAETRRVEQIVAAIQGNRFDPTRHAALARAEVLAKRIAESTTALERATSQLRTLESAAEQAAAQVPATVKQLKAARGARDAAEEALHHAQMDNAAALIQTGLAAGDPCPVCGSAVGDLPHVEHTDLDAARKAAAAERDAEQRAHDLASKMKAAADQAASSVQHATQRVDDLTQEHATAQRDLAEALPDEPTITLPRIRAALQEQAEASSTLAALREDERTCRQQLSELQSTLAEARESLAALQTQAQRAAETAEHEQAVKDAACQELMALAEGEKWPTIAARAQTEDVTDELQASLLAARARYSELQEAKGRIEEQLKTLERQIEQRRLLEGELGTLIQHHNVAADLAQMLRADRFQTFVQSEALRLLAGEGSRRLQDLSTGRYELVVGASGQDFEVIDRWNADERRSVRTLSGGETFLASLALALGLAETLPGLASTCDVALDSIFLDEGFGSLDQEALDRAADALDSLRARNRLVCIVTHLKELAERLPARIVVQKSETGSTVLVV